MGSKKNTEVVVTVDTEKINEGNIQAVVEFSDDRKEIPDNSRAPEKHIAIVDKNMKIFWKGKPKNGNSENRVMITEVGSKEGDGGPQILKKTLKDPDRDGVVFGKIRNTEVKGDESYYIKFTVKGDPDMEFTIDPKLRMTRSRE